jgi:hypothetical protein
MWGNNLAQKLYIMVELLYKEFDYKDGDTYRDITADNDKEIITEYEPIGSTIIIASNLDGTIRYGTYEQPFFVAPYNIAEPKENK